MIGETADKVRPVLVKIKDQGDYEVASGNEELSTAALSLVSRPTSSNVNYAIGFTATDYAGNDPTLLLDGT